MATEAQSQVLLRSLHGDPGQYPCPTCLTPATVWWELERGSSNYSVRPACKRCRALFITDPIVV